MAIEELRAKNFRWINLTNLKSMKGPEVQFMRKNFGFHELNLEDSLAVGQRPKIDINSKYFFLVMLYPLYDRKTGVIKLREIDFFVSKNYLITVHDNKIPIITRFFNCRCGKSWNNFSNKPI